jgi:hypothetical protein
VDSNNLENGAVDITPKANKTINTSAGEVDLTRIENQLDQIAVRLKHMDRRDRIRTWFGLLRILIPIGALILVYYLSDSIIASLSERFSSIIQLALPRVPEGVNLNLPEGIDASALPDFLQNLLP